jgi:hypothetical protein
MMTQEKVTGCCHLDQLLPSPYEASRGHQLLRSSSHSLPARTHTRARRCACDIQTLGRASLFKLGSWEERSTLRWHTMLGHHVGCQSRSRMLMLMEETLPPPLPPPRRPPSGCRDSAASTQRDDVLPIRLLLASLHQRIYFLSISCMYMTHDLLVSINCMYITPDLRRLSI